MFVSAGLVTLRKPVLVFTPLEVLHILAGHSANFQLWQSFVVDVARCDLFYRVDARGLVWILEIILQRNHINSSVPVCTARQFWRELAFQKLETFQILLAGLGDRPRLSLHWIVSRFKFRCSVWFSKFGPLLRKETRIFICFDFVSNFDHT